MAMSTTTGGMHGMGGRRGKYNISSLLMAITNTSTTADSSRGWLISICARDDDITASRKR